MIVIEGMAVATCDATEADPQGDGRHLASGMITVRVNTSASGA